MTGTLPVPNAILALVAGAAAWAAGLPSPHLPGQSSQTALAAGARQPTHDSRAMWHWDPSPQLLDLREREAFLRFCQEQAIDRAWMQISLDPADDRQPTVSAARPDVSAPQLRLRHALEWRSFLADAHRAGLKVEALDGSPRWALQENHHEPLALVDAVIDFNNAGPPSERFDGIHLDNEPYLLFEWRDPVQREQILREFLELNAECQRRVRERSTMVYGVDVPFWWHYRNELTGRAHGDVSFNGVRKPASFHCIDLLDNVGIMNYRNVAAGSDGLIAHGLALLVYAEQTKRARIYMGVETSRSEPAPTWFVAGLPEGDFLAALDRRRRFPERIGGFATRVFDDGRNLHAGLELPGARDPGDQAALAVAMQELAGRFGASARASFKQRASEFLGTALRALDRDPEWEDPSDYPFVDPVTSTTHAGFRATRIMLPKITFAGRTLDEMHRELELAERQFSTYTQYAGIAIHHYEAYRQKVVSASRPLGNPVGSVQRP